MTEPLFDIVFRGDIVMGQNIQDVKGRLGQLFKVDAAKVEALFAGGVVALKRDLDKSTAEKYKAVLTKAGAQVQIRPAEGPKSAAPTPVPAARNQSVSTDAESSDPDSGTQAPPAGGDFTLAPAGSNLLSPSEVRQIQALDLDLSGISIKPLEGDLLDESEKTKPVAPDDVQVGDYQVAAAGTDLLDGFQKEELPLAEIDVDFDLAEVGADLLAPADRSKQPPVEVDISHLEVLPNK
ncbi:MAG: hypothetical protein WDZ30_12030 [Cellvibrionaceae bacterium]